MRYIFTLSLFLISLSGFAQTTNDSYNQNLADSLGADDYGMKTYTFVALKTGTTKIADRDSMQVLMRGHLANISRLAEAGKIILAGPYGKNDLGFRGLFVFDSSDTTEVRQMLNTDPAIAIGVFETELIPWYGSAAIPMYMPYHKAIEKMKP